MKKFLGLFLFPSVYPPLSLFGCLTFEVLIGPFLPAAIVLLCLPSYRIRAIAFPRIQLHVESLLSQLSLFYRSLDNPATLQKVSFSLTIAKPQDNTLAPSLGFLEELLLH